jgi:hypothetical protein
MIRGLGATLIGLANAAASSGAESRSIASPSPATTLTGRSG